MKKLINLPESIIPEMFEGIAVLSPSVTRLQGYNVLIRSDAVTIRDRQVALISGGGSGHEPAHAGYIGQGMLSAAVAGDIFTSPSADSVFAAIRAVTGKPGALLIVKNYTGDRLNFGLAAEMARAEGIPVKVVIVADDVALRDKLETAGARGLAGTVLIHKIAGAAAAEGSSLEEIRSAAQAAADSMGTMGVSLSAGTSPLVGKPSFTLADDEMELGLGIHGEPGVRRAELPSADAVTETLIESILTSLALQKKERIIVMINNLGATTTMELAIVARSAFANLESRGLQVERVYGGTFLSSLDMAGISLTILPVDDQRLSRLDAATSAAAWPSLPRERPASLKMRTWTVPSMSVETTLVQRAESLPHRLQTATAQNAEHAIRAACAAILKAEDRLTALDQAVGDGDLGISLARGARALEQALPSYPLDEVPATLKAIGNTLRTELGGSSGPLYGVFFIRASNAPGLGKPSALKEWAIALRHGCDAMSELGGAKYGDRTMLDALIPFAQTLEEAGAEGKQPSAALESAAATAERGATETAKMIPRRGRSSYLGERALGHPDPGAVAASIWLRAIVEAIAGTVRG